jgi:hypothetical protein
MNGRNGYFQASNFALAVATTFKECAEAGLGPLAGIRLAVRLDVDDECRADRGE